MTAIRFTIETTVDLPSRPGIMAPGELRSGVVRAGTVLRIEGTNQEVTVLGVEFRCTAGSEATRIRLMVDRKDAPLLQPGTVLVSPT